MSTDTKSIPAANVSLAAAYELIAAAQKAANERGFDAAVAVVDATGSLRAFARADKTPFLAGEIAINKAWTAASYGFPTHVWNQVIQDPAVAPLSQHPRVTAVPGGYGISENGLLIGGIGVSGGDAEQDQRACEAALEAVGFGLTQA